MLSGQQADQFVLVWIGVLEFIHHHVLKTAAVMREEVRISLKEFDGKRYQVLIVPGLVLQLELPVLPEYVDLLGGEAPVFQQVGIVGVQRVHFGAVHPAAQLVPLVTGVMGRMAFQQPFNGFSLLAVVHDFPVAAEISGISIFPQNPQSKGVKGGNGKLPGINTGQLLNPLLHLTGRFVGECNAQYGSGRELLFPDKVSDFVGNDPGFPRSGSGHDQQGRVKMQDGFLLLGVHPLGPFSWHDCAGSGGQTGQE